MTEKLTHFDERGAARMVDVGPKAETARGAVATGTIRMRPETLALVLSGFHPSFALLLDEVGYQAGPASLVARAHTSAVVAVEVLVERDVVAPMRVALEQVDLAEYGPPPASVAEEDALQAAGDIACDLPKRQLLAGT